MRAPPPNPNMRQVKPGKRRTAVEKKRIRKTVDDHPESGRTIGRDHGHLKSKGWDAEETFAWEGSVGSLPESDKIGAK
jgi:hypothetical protein